MKPTPPVTKGQGERILGCGLLLPLVLAAAFFLELPEVNAQELNQDSLDTDYYGTDASNNLVNLASLSGATNFYSNGIYGQNTTSWVVDEFVVSTNLFPAENFTNLVSTYVPTGVMTNTGEHATWCAAILGAYAPPGYYLNTGMAPGTKLGSAPLATSTNTDGSFNISTNSFESYIYAASHGDVLSTSIGDSSDPSGIGTLSGLLDSLAVADPNTTIIAAAGNNGPTNGSVGAPASGYNSISVGALDGPTNYSVLASFSSRGPLATAWYDGTNVFYYKNGAATRPGVDLTAPGTDIVMPVAFMVGSNSISYSYYTISGTSFATPLVAGGAALLDSTAKTAFSASLTNAATQSVVVKAVLMNSADKLSGWNNGQQIASGVITTTQALDYAMGAGRMNLNTAFTQYTSSAYVTTYPGITETGFNLPVAGTGWAYGTDLKGGKNDYTITSRLFAGEEIAVTLAWLRDQTWNNTISDYVDVAQAELDLMVYQVLGGGSDQLVAQSISPVSTTQELYFQLLSTGTYMVEVSYSTNLFDLSGTYASQEYGLAWSVAGIPEPETLFLVVLGGIAMMFSRHHSKLCRWLKGTWHDNKRS